MSGLPPGLAEVDLPFPSNYIGSLLYAFGKELQLLLGVPTVIVREDFGLSDTALELMSTLGLPPNGTLVGGGFKIKYTSKTDIRVNVPLLKDEPRHAVLTKGSELRLLTSSVLPPNYQSDIAALQSSSPIPIIQDLF
jgi:hypothetical protein